MSVAIRVENVSKLYRLGLVGTRTLSDDVSRLWARLRGKEDPFQKVGQTNRRDEPRAKSQEPRAEGRELRAESQALNADAPRSLLSAPRSPLPITSGR